MKVATLYKGPIVDWHVNSPVGRKFYADNHGDVRSELGMARRTFMRSGAGLLVIVTAPVALSPEAVLAQRGGLVRGTVTALELLRAIIELLGTLPLNTSVANTSQERKSGLLVCDYRGPTGKVTDQTDEEVTLEPGFAQDLQFEGGVGGVAGQGIATVTSGVNKKSAPYKIA